MPIIKQKNRVTWFSGQGVHSLNVGCLAEDREKCTCQYHISDGKVQYGFDSYQEAEAKWCELTDTKKFRLGKDVW